MTSSSLTFGRASGDDWLTVELAELRRAFPDRDWQPVLRHRWRSHDLQRDVWYYVQFTGGSTAYAVMPIAAEYVETYPNLDRVIDDLFVKAMLRHVHTATKARVFSRESRHPDDQVTGTELLSLAKLPHGEIGANRT